MKTLDWQEHWLDLGTIGFDFMVDIEVQNLGKKRLRSI
jgi:hypothetical protein